MGKIPLDQQLRQRLEKIAELQKIIDAANSELMELTGLSIKEKTAPNQTTPLGFSLKKEIMAIFEETKRPFSSNEMVAELKTRTGTDVGRKNVQSSLDYLAKNQNLLTKEGEGRGNIKYQLK